MLNRNASHSVPPRVGFTLVEILIVIGIIGLLVATLVIAIGPSLESARIDATRTTIAQIDAAIQARVEAIAKLDVSVEAKKLAALNSGMDVREAEFFIRKNLYRQALPQREWDLRGMDLASGGGDDAPFAGGWLSGADPGEIFFRAITQGDSLRVIPDGKVYTVPTLNVDDINPNHLRDNDGDDLPDEFIDEWNQPLAFYNFPTRLIKDNGSAINLSRAQILISGLPSDTSTNGPLDTDPLDPTGTAYSDFAGASDTDTVSITYRPPSTAITARVFHENNYHTIGTYYVPLLVSAGPDQVLALHEPDATAPNHLGRFDSSNTLDELTDNITNRQQ